MFRFGISVVLVLAATLSSVSGHTYAYAMCDCDQMGKCKENSRISKSYTKDTVEYKKLSSAGAGKYGFPFVMRSLR